MSELPDGVFGNLTRLQDSSLVSNQLTELPDGIFQGLTTLRHLYIGENTVSPFTIAAELERRDANTIALRVAQATPFDMIVTLSAEGGALSSTTVPIAAGSVSSGPVTVSPDGYGLVTVSVVSAAFELREFNTAIGIQTGLGNPITLGANTPATGAPMVSGTAQVGKTLTADTSTIADADGMSDAVFTYQWLADDAAIAGATGSTYTLVSADAGQTVKVRVSFTDDAGKVEKLTSAATDAVAPPPNSPATGLPTISGTAQVGETLTADVSGIADADGLSDVTFQYRWLSSRDTEIPGATNSTYVLQASDAEKTVKVRVSFTDDAGNEESLTSEATAAVSAAPPPAPSNLRVVTGKGSVELTWEAPDDATVTGYRIERRRADGPHRDNHTLVEDTGSSETGYTDQSAEKGVEYEYRVSARNEDGAGEIPSELGGLSNLTRLDLFSNQLTGEIPSELGGLSNLTRLVFSNQLTGEIPSELGGLSNLTRLDLFSNQLTGEIPSELGNLSNLTHLWLSDNQLTGCIPEGLRDIAENDLVSLNLPDCGATTPGPTATPTPASEMADGVCHVGLIVRPGESCTYPGTSAEFSVDSSGTGRFLFFTAGTGIDARNTTINGVTYNFKASKQGDGTWIIEAAGDS